jgi:membrane-associated protein
MILYLILDVFLHLDVHLAAIITAYGPLTYAILFLVIFCETGLVFTPFLPGDSLLFAAGAFAFRGALNPFLLTIILLVAAILGDTCNYWLGGKLGRRVFKEHRKFLSLEHLHATEAFYEKHGGKAIIFARFLPMFRTIAPFVAGIGKMNYGRFLMNNVIGAVIWVLLFVWGGYFFGSIPAVEHNFSLVILAIIVLSFVPATIHGIRHWKSKR